MSCSVVGCNERFSGCVKNSLSFLGFPKDEKFCAEWIRRIGRDPKTFNLHHSRICSKHFEASQLITGGHRVKKRKNCVPTLHLPTAAAAEENAFNPPPPSTSIEMDAELRTIIDILKKRKASPPSPQNIKKKRRSSGGEPEPANCLYYIEAVENAIEIKKDIDDEDIIHHSANPEGGHQLCRLCLTETTNPCASIFDKFNLISNSPTTTMTVLDAIEELINLKIPKEDDLSLPTVICGLCYGMLGQIYEFRQQCKSSQTKLTNLPSLAHKLNEKRDSKLAEDPLGATTTHWSDNSSSSESDVHKSEGYDDAAVSDSSILGDDNTVGTFLKFAEDKRLTPNTNYDYGNRQELTYPCYKCGLRFPLLKLQYHLNVHSKIYPFLCVENDCTKSFTAINALNVHLRKKHGKSASTKINDLSKLPE